MADVALDVTVADETAAGVGKATEAMETEGSLVPKPVAMVKVLVVVIRVTVAAFVEAVRKGKKPCNVE